jgi:hypothetical protein
LFNYFFDLLNYSHYKMGIGDWGLGIGDWAQSPYNKYFFQKKLDIFINPH